jgi:hypothetical protein
MKIALIMVTIVLIGSYLWLLYGVTLKHFRLFSYDVSNVTLRLGSDHKFILYADQIVINKKSQPSQKSLIDTLHDLEQLFKTYFPYISYIKSININTFMVGDVPLTLQYDQQKLRLKTTAYDLTFRFRFQAKALKIAVENATLVEHGIVTKGVAHIDLDQESFRYKGWMDYAGIDTKVLLISDFSTIDFQVQSKPFTDLTPLHSWIPPTIVNVIQAQNYQVNFVGGRVDVDSLVFEPRSLKLRMQAKDVLLTYDQTRPAIKLDQVDLSIENGKLIVAPVDFSYEDVNVETFALHSDDIFTNIFVANVRATKEINDHKVTTIGVVTIHANEERLSYDGIIEEASVKGDIALVSDLKEATLTLALEPFYSLAFVKTFIPLDIFEKIEAQRYTLKRLEGKLDLETMTFDQAYLKLEAMVEGVNVNLDQTKALALNDMTIVLDRKNFSITPLHFRYGENIAVHNLIIASPNIYSNTLNVSADITSPHVNVQLNEGIVDVEKKELKANVRFDHANLFGRTVTPPQSDVVIDFKKDLRALFKALDLTVVQEGDNLKVDSKDLAKTLGIQSSIKNEFYLEKEQEHLFVTAELSPMIMNMLMQNKSIQTGMIKLNGTGKITKHIEGKVTLDDVGVQGSKFALFMAKLVTLVDAIVLPDEFKTAKKGTFHIDRGEIKYTYRAKDNTLWINAIDIYGNGLHIEGSGLIELTSKKLDINLKIFFLKSLSNITKEIPALDYIIFGEDKRFGIEAHLGGTLDDHNYTTEVTKEMILTPFKMLKRTGETLFDTFTKPFKD